MSAQPPSERNFSALGTYDLTMPGTMVADSRKLWILHAFDQRTQSTVASNEKEEEEEEEEEDACAHCLLPASSIPSFRQGRILARPRWQQARYKLL
jgi:hypothetical protein